MHDKVLKQAHAVDIIQTVTKTLVAHHTESDDLSYFYFAVFHYGYLFFTSHADKNTRRTEVVAMVIQVIPVNRLHESNEKAVVKRTCFDYACGQQVVIVQPI